MTERLASGLQAKVIAILAKRPGLRASDIGWQLWGAEIARLSALVAELEARLEKCLWTTQEIDPDVANRELTEACTGEQEVLPDLLAKARQEGAAEALEEIAAGFEQCTGPLSAFLDSRSLRERAAKLREGR